MTRLRPTRVATPLLALLLGALLLATAPAASIAVSAPASPPHVATLGLGESAFWPGPTIVGRLEYSPSAALNPVMRGTLADASCKQGVSCFDHVIEVTATSGRLRVAADAPMKGGTEMDLIVTAPSGERAFSTWSYAGAIPLRSQEAFMDITEAGSYVARVYVFYAENVHITMRAMVEAPAPVVHQTELPDLRSEPPFEFAWEAPGIMEIPVQCYPDEEQVDGATRCLRFSFGWQNVGAGMLDLVFDRLAPEATGLTGPVLQRVYATDGSFADHPDAGDYEWHVIHNHYHYKQFFQGELLRVTDGDGGLESVAPVRKIGGCSHDWKMVEWTRFVQAPAGTDSGAECGVFGMGTPTQTHIALSAGWRDFYFAGTQGNYVDFGSNPDGDYVVRMVMDPDHLLLESDETNNVGYALIRIAGEEITMLERGHGTDPWDAAKHVLPLTA